MNRMLITFIFLTFTLTGSAQELTSREVYGSFVFAREGRIITLNEMVSEQARGTELKRQFRSGRRNQLWGSVLGGTGAALIGVALSDALSNNDDEDSLHHWQTYVICGTLVGVSFPLLSTAERRIGEAVMQYNASDAMGSARRSGIEAYAGSIGSGVGIGVRF